MRLTSSHCAGAIRALVPATGRFPAGWILLGCAILSSAVTPARLVWSQKPDRSVGAGQEKVTSKDGDAEGARIEDLLARLDSERFGSRNDATRKLTTMGPEVIPALVDALGAESREVRFRVEGILSNYYSFDDVAPILVKAVPLPHGIVARAILRQRALRQVEEAGQTPYARKLFEFWGTDVTEFRRRITFHLIETRSRRAASKIVAPLIGLRGKAKRFQGLLSRIEALSLTYEHRHSPGYVLAETLANGLQYGNEEGIRFAERYIAAFETLVQELRSQEASKRAIRNEVADRASMSDGATSYLVNLMKGGSPAGRILAARLDISVDELQDAFFRGLATTDTRECYRCVGKVHIVDMLTEAIAQWPDAPTDGVAQNLIDSVAATVATGDKRKALALLDALEGCAELSAHGLDIRHGLGLRISQRLYLAATIAADTRAFYPTRACHDRIMKLIDLGITPEHAAFPRQLMDDFLKGAINATSEQRRNALTRFLTIVERLKKENVDLEQPGARRFLLLMHDALAGDDALLKSGVAELDRLFGDRNSRKRAPIIVDADQALLDWVAKRKQAK